MAILGFDLVRRHMYGVGPSTLILPVNVRQLVVCTVFVVNCSVYLVLVLDRFSLLSYRNRCLRQVPVSTSFTG